MIGGGWWWLLGWLVVGVGVGWWLVLVVGWLVVVLLKTKTFHPYNFFINAFYATNSLLKYEEFGNMN